MNWTVESNQMQWETRVAQELRSQLRQTACMPIPQSLVSVWSLNAYQSAHFGCLFLPIQLYLPVAEGMQNLYYQNDLLVIAPECTPKCGQQLVRYRIYLPLLTQYQLFIYVLSLAPYARMLLLTVSVPLSPDFWTTALLYAGWSLVLIARLTRFYALQPG